MAATKGISEDRGQSDTQEAVPRLLAGGNPQIPKGDGDGPVQSYIANMPDWKREIGAVLDDLIVQAVPGVRKAVKWNQPFYGIDGDGWFVSFRCFTKYVQLTFFQGVALEPPPPKKFKKPEARALMIHEHDELAADLLISWLQQASRLPGEQL